MNYQALLFSISFYVGTILWAIAFFVPFDEEGTFLLVSPWLVIYSLMWLFLSVYLVEKG